MDKLFVPILLVLMYYLVKLFTGFSMKDVMAFFSPITKTITRQSIDVRENYKKKQKITKARDIKGFKTTAYRELVTSIIENLGDAKLSVTVEGFSVFLLLSTLILTGTLSWLIIRNIICQILLIPIFYSTLLGIFYSISRKNYMKHIEDVMAAEDMLAPLVSKGISNAIRELADDLPKSLRDDFAIFVVEEENTSLGFDNAMNNLAKRLGIYFSDFAADSINYNRIGAEGMQEGFRDIVKSNERLRSINRKKVRAFDDKVSTFKIVSVILAAFTAFALNMYPDAAVDFMFSSLGNIVFLFIIAVISGVFILIQAQYRDIR